MSRATLNRICRLLFTSPFGPPLDRKGFLKAAFFVFVVRYMLISQCILAIALLITTGEGVHGFLAEPEMTFDVILSRSIPVQVIGGLLFILCISIVLIPYFFVLYRRLTIYYTKLSSKYVTITSVLCYICLHILEYMNILDSNFLITCVIVYVLLFFLPDKKQHIE